MNLFSSCFRGESNVLIILCDFIEMTGLHVNAGFGNFGKLHVRSSEMCRMIFAVHCRMSGRSLPWFGNRLQNAPFLLYKVCNAQMEFPGRVAILMLCTTGVPAVHSKIYTVGKVRFRNTVREYGSALRNVRVCASGNQNPFPDVW